MKKQDTLINWIYAHKICVIIATILLALFLPIFIVHFLFKWDLGIAWLNPEWEAGDVLAYLAGFETFLGTCLLSFAALRQEEQARKSAERFELANTKRPFFIIDKVTVSKDKNEEEIKFSVNQYRHVSDDIPVLHIYLKNVGDGVANETYYKPYGWGKIPLHNQQRECVAINGEYKVDCYVSSDFDDANTEIITVFYRNIIGFRYKQILIINIVEDMVSTDVESYEREDGNIIPIPSCYLSRYTTDVELISPQIYDDEK